MNPQNNGSFSFATPDSNEDIANFEVGEGFTLQVKYADPELLRKLGRKATVRKWKNGQQYEEVDSDKYSRYFIREIVVGWDATYRAIHNVAPFSKSFIDDLKARGGSVDDKVPFSVENCIQLFGANIALENSLLGFTRDVSNFGVGVDLDDHSPEELEGN